MPDAVLRSEGTLFLTQLLYHLTQVERHLGPASGDTQALEKLRVRNLLNEAIARALLCVLHGDPADPDLLPRLFGIAGTVYSRELNWALERAIKLE